jgi:hypothetical protein
MAIPPDPKVDAAAVLEAQILKLKAMLLGSRKLITF